METDYIAQYMQIFRHTVYASTGYRSSLSDSTSQYTVVNITDNTMIIDRSGNLLMRRATEAIRMKLSKYPLVFQWKRGLSMCPISVSIDSALLNAFAELHNYLSLKSMIDAVCRSKSNDHNCEEKARFGLISSINFLGSIGMISCWN